MPPLLFCGACFFYIIPPPGNRLSSGFWHLLPPGAEKAGAAKKKSRVRSNPAERAAAHHSVQRPFLFTVIFIHSQHVLFSSLVCSCSPFAACIRPAVKKPTLTPTKKSTSPTTSLMVSSSFFVFHSLPRSICRMRPKPVVRCKFSCPGARFFCRSVAQPCHICYTAVSIPRFYENFNETR